MKYFLLVLIVIFDSCSHSYYIVRHAEKADVGVNMISDVPLSDKGKERAEALKELLKNKKIAFVFSTNTIRTKATAQPTADYFGLKIETYGPALDSAFISLLKSLKKNVLVVGHSNTVDEIVNKLCGSIQISSDLKDSEYDNLFIVTRKGNRYFLIKKKYGFVSAQ